MSKLIVLGVTGSIAAIKSFELCRELRRKGFEVQIVMSSAAEDMITKDSMEFASGKEVITRISGKVEHVKLFGKKGKADLLLIAPATANTISKIAMGIDDTPITTCATVAIGSKKPVLIAPAMHKPMYEHPIVLENLEKLKERGVKVIAPLEKEGKAKMQSINEIIFETEKALSKKKLKGKKIIVASGSFGQKIDDVRALTNLSSGKTGKEICLAAMKEGAEVKLIGNGEMESFIDFEEAKDSEELERALLQELKKNHFEEVKQDKDNLGKEYDYFFCPAAINDFTIEKREGKIPSGKKITLTLSPREKTLQKVSKKFPELKIIAFKALAGETRKNIEKKSKEFRKKNGYFAVVANDISENPPGNDETEFFFCGKKSKWMKGTKKELAEKIIEMI